jgi:sarcosine oxidase
LLHVTGSIDAGPEDSFVFAGSLRSCLDHGIDHEVVDARELGRRYPGYRLPDEALALIQPDGGFLLPERCIVAHVERAQAHGAEIRARERVLEWQPTAEGGVRVQSDRSVYEADRLVLATGAWIAKLAGLGTDLVVAERQVLAWLQPRRPELFSPARFPVFNVMVEEGRYYGFPVFAVPGFKFGRYHHLEERVDPDSVDREPRHRDEEVLRQFAARYFPDASGPTMALKVCLFENSSDEHFVLDLHPDQPQVVLAAGFSGHGFKFCSVIGEVVADLALQGSTAHEIEFLRLARLQVPS